MKNFKIKTRKKKALHWGNEFKWNFMLFAKHIYLLGKASGHRESQPIVSSRLTKQLCFVSHRGWIQLKPSPLSV